MVRIRLGAQLRASTLWARRRGKRSRLVAAGALGALLLGPQMVPPAVAAPTAEVGTAQVNAAVQPGRFVTWNMQGRSGDGPDTSKWPVVDGLKGDADLIALQEAGTERPDGGQLLNRYRNYEDEEVGDAVDVPEDADDGAVNNDPNLPPLRYDLTETKVGRDGGRNSGYLYFLKIHPLQRPLPNGNIPRINPRGVRTSMAIWSRQEADGFGAVFDPARNRSRPALGLRFGDNWVFNVHTAAIRSERTPNPHALGLLGAIRAGVGEDNWAVLGDFNSLADTFPENQGIRLFARRGGVATNPAQMTHRSGYPLDFMVVAGQRGDVNVSVGNDIGSDHFPVRIAPPGPVDCTRWNHTTRYRAAGVRDEASSPRAGAADAEDPNCSTDGRPTAAVSLGDSYISGEAGRWAGNADTGEAGYWGTDRGDSVYGNTKYDGGNGCERSDVAEINSAALAVDRRINLACSGAETKNLLTDAFKGERPQVEQLADVAKDNRVTLIAVSIGGNDLKFADVLASCGKAFFNLGPDCENRGGTGWEKALETSLPDTQQKVSATLAAIRDVMRRAGQSDTSYRLVLQSYPTPLPRAADNRYENSIKPRYSQGGCPFTDAASDWAVESVVPRITSMLRAAATTADAEFLDLTKAFAGHELCAKNARQAGGTDANGVPGAEAEWVRWVPYLAGVPIPEPHQQGDYREAVHPNSFGQQAIGACLAALANREPDWTRREFRCTNTPGKGPDGVTGEPVSPSYVEEGWVRLRNAETGEYLRPYEPGSKWVVTGPSGEAGREWFMANGQAGMVTLRSNQNNYLRGDGGASWQWAALGDSAEWFTSDDAVGGARQLKFVDIMQGLPATFCLAHSTSRPTHWASGDPCSDAKNQRWWIERVGASPPPPPPPLERATTWTRVVDRGLVTNRVSTKCIDVDTRDADGRRDGGRIHQWGCGGWDNQQWDLRPRHGDGSMEMVSRYSGKCLDLDVGSGRIQQWGCGGGNNQQWFPDGEQFRNKHSNTCLAARDGADGSELTMGPCLASPVWDGDAGDPFDAGDGRFDDGGARPARPADQAACRPDGMQPTQGVATRYCDVYQGDGREWLGQDRGRRVVGYFTSWRTGADNSPRYLVKNIPWNKVTHVNYAFAKVEDNRISVGDVNDPNNPSTGMTWPGVTGAEMDPALPYKGHFNLLTRYKRDHPRVKTLISVGGWAESRGFYRMTTNDDGTANQPAIDTFADSVTEFLARYGFDGVDIDYEYPSALPQSGNPDDWPVSDPVRGGLNKSYDALMKTLRERLDTSGADRGRYLLLTSAASSSGYLVRGQENQPALQYQDFINVMSYDLHGSWNSFVGPQAPLYDDGRDAELAAAGIYNDRDPNTKDFQKNGYFNVDWSYHYYRGALPPGRINLGMPYYTRGWKDVQGGTDGLWGSSVKTDQGACSPGTGDNGGKSKCGSGAIGIDNLWHDTDRGREVAAGSNPLWHAKNLENNIQPRYMGRYGLTPDRDADDRMSGTYARRWDDTLKASWLWNAEKRVFLSTEDEQSIDTKVQYVKDNGIGGVMLWEMAGDYARRDNGEYGMGYDLTSRIDGALRGTSGYGDTRAGRPMPPQSVDVKVQLVDYPSTEMYPMQPKLRITNDSAVTLAQGTEIAFDIPTSTPPVLKDDNYKEMPIIRPGRTGPNVGGLGADFHRITVKLEKCQDIPPGKSLDIGIKYYLPITGPANVTVKVGDWEFGVTTENRRAVTGVQPPEPEAGTCSAPEWKSGTAYSPTGGRLWSPWNKGAKGWQFEYQGKLMDHYPDQSRVHLIEPIESNTNQYWQVTDAGGGWYRIVNGNRCLTATTGGKDLSTTGCDGSDRQKWRFVPVDLQTGAEGTPGGPAHGVAAKLRSASGFDAEAQNGSAERETHVLAGDPAGSSAAFVSWQGYFWYAQWYTTVEPGLAEPNGGRPWRRLGATP
ncbi:glycosyl hydrolase family 18 protein [Embleya sp. NPDC020630]|uniref:glycosyl hydrolase family 18 protein n=1 Tax=Embleya sp. NPDC020630 TaxID=3363979 RepID=UPI00378DC167